MAISGRGLPAAEGALVAAYGSASPKRSAGLKVNNVVWRVSGSDSPLRQALVDAIDRTRLQALVGKPLPAVVESRALSAQAVPATVATTPSVAAPQPVAAPNPSAPAAPGQAPAAEPIKDAVDTVNKLRGLFGR